MGYSISNANSWRAESFVNLNMWGIRSQLCIRTTLATLLNCLFVALCYAQAAPQITPADIYPRAHSSVVVVIVADSSGKPTGQGSGFIVAKETGLSRIIMW